MAALFSFLRPPRVPPMFDRGCSIVAFGRNVVESVMLPNSFASTSQLTRSIVLDDHRRLPGRFFGRFTTSIVNMVCQAG
jgi:hypothetical protein